MTAAPERETPAAFLNSLEKKIQYVVLHSIQKIFSGVMKLFFPLRTTDFQHLSLVRTVTQNNETAGQCNEEISRKLIGNSLLVH